MVGRRVLGLALRLVRTVLDILKKAVRAHGKYSDPGRIDRLLDVGRLHDTAHR